MEAAKKLRDQLNEAIEAAEMNIPGVCVFVCESKRLADELAYTVRNSPAKVHVEGVMVVCAQSTEHLNAWNAAREKMKASKLQISGSIVTQ
jgi:hypothetical protein